jgi:hypothetical protein
MNHDRPACSLVCILTEPRHPPRTWAHVQIYLYLNFAVGRSNVLGALPNVWKINNFINKTELEQARWPNPWKKENQIVQ